MTGNDCPRDTHELWDVAETSHIHPDGGDADRFDRPLNVPHGHVTHRSNRHQQNHIDTLVPKLLGPTGRNIALEPEL